MSLDYDGFVQLLMRGQSQEETILTEEEEPRGGAQDDWVEPPNLDWNAMVLHLHEICSMARVRLNQS